MNWRNLPPTQKQLDYIAELREMSELPLPPYKGSTRGEASDWIDANISRAHHTALNWYEYGVSSE